MLGKDFMFEAAKETYPNQISISHPHSMSHNSSYTCSVFAMLKITRIFLFAYCIAKKTTLLLSQAKT